MATYPLHLLSWKMAFLVAVTSAKHASELAAFCSDSPYTVFHKDKVVLSPDPLFLLKGISSLHLSQPMVLPVFFPASADDCQHVLHCLDVCRVLAYYLTVLLLGKMPVCLFLTLGLQRALLSHLRGFLRGLFCHSALLPAGFQTLTCCCASSFHQSGVNVSCLLCGHFLGGHLHCGNLVLSISAHESLCH